MDISTIKTTTILGTRVHMVQNKDVLQYIEEKITNFDGRCRFIVNTGFHGLWVAHNDATFKHILNSADIFSPDGIAVVGKSKKVDGFYLGIGMCGQGFMMGPGVGLNLSNLITNGKPLIEEKVFNLLSPDRNFYSGKKEALK